VGIPAAGAGRCFSTCAGELIHSYNIEYKQLT